MKAIIFITLILASLCFAMGSTCSENSDCGSCNTAAGNCYWCSSNSTCQDYTQTSCPAWSTRTCDQCPSEIIIAAGWGQPDDSIPQPSVTMTFDSTNSKFDFTVTAAYIREGYTWVVDFESWDRNTRQINAPNNCENRLSSSFSGLQFDQFFSSAQFAQLPDSLNTVTNLPYGPSGWTLAASSCSTVTYSRAFSFQDLVGCKGSSGNQLIAVANTNSSTVIQYSGTLRVSSVKPVDIASQSAGYAVQEFSYPFIFDVVSYVENVASFSGDNAFSASVLSMKLVNNNLVMEIETDLSSSSGLGNYVISPVPISTPVDVSMTEGPDYIVVSGSPCTTLNSQGQCRQTFTVSSTSSSLQYNGLYTFQWTVVQCTISTGTCTNTNRQVIGQVKISQSNVGTSTLNTGLQTAMTTYLGNFASQTNGPFYSGDTVSIKEALQVASSDVNSFVLSIQNVWVCYPSTTGFVPVYNPTAGQFGCSQAYNGVAAANILQIVSGGVPTTATAVEVSFNTAMNAPFSNAFLPYNTTTGFTFSAKPITTTSRTYYFQIEMQITTAGSSSSRRDAVTAPTSSQTVSLMSQGLVFEAEPRVVQITQSSVSERTMSVIVFCLAFVLAYMAL